MTKNEIKKDKILQEIAKIAFERKGEIKLISFSASADFHFGVAEIKFTYHRKNT